MMYICAFANQNPRDAGIGIGFLIVHHDHRTKEGSTTYPNIIGCQLCGSIVPSGFNCKIMSCTSPKYTGRYRRYIQRMPIENDRTSLSLFGHLTIPESFQGFYSFEEIGDLAQASGRNENF